MKIYLSIVGKAYILTKKQGNKFLHVCRKGIEVCSWSFSCQPAVYS